MSRIQWEQHEEFTQFYNHLDLIVQKIRSVQLTAIRPLDITVKILEHLTYNYREVKFEVKYLIKKWAKDEFAPSDEEQLRQILTEIKDFEDSENIYQRPKLEEKQFNKRLLEYHIYKRIGHISRDCRSKLNHNNFKNKQTFGGQKQKQNENMVRTCTGCSKRQNKNGCKDL